MVRQAACPAGVRRSHDERTLVVGEGLKPAAIGIVIGLGEAGLAGRIMRTFLRWAGREVDCPTSRVQVFGAGARAPSRDFNGGVFGGHHAAAGVADDQPDEIGSRGHVERVAHRQPGMGLKGLVAQA